MLRFAIDQLPVRVGVAPLVRKAKWRRFAD